MRVFATSDLHVDFEANRLVLEQLSDVEFCQDVLIVAGDIAHRMSLIEEALCLLKGKFREVFYVPGNHELWVRGEAGDSLEKFQRILELCESLDVRTKPLRLDDCCIVPLFSWYHPSFDAADRVEEGMLEGWGDFRYCKWPEEIESQCRFFSHLNEPHIRSVRENEPSAKVEVISFSHFLPRPELLPDVDFLWFKGLPRVAGCHSIEKQIRDLGADVHVFGHSHIRRDLVIDGVRYVQHHLGYPRERRGREFVLKEIVT